MAESLRALVEAVRMLDAKCYGEIAERGTGALTEYGYAVQALSDHLLTHPEAVEAVEALAAATERAERAEAAIDGHRKRYDALERKWTDLVNSESNKALKARAAKLVEEIDALKERNRQAVGDWRKVRAELTASATHAESVERDLAAARALLREVVDSVAECVNLPACCDPDEPMERSEWCQFCDISARIEAHHGRDE